MQESEFVEETHYYPFWLTMAGISSKAAGKETESPYSSMANNPILKSDPLGDEAEGGPGDPPGILERIGNSVSGFISAMRDRAKMNIARDVEWVKNT